MSDQYLTPKDIRERFQVCARTVETWRTEGSGPPFVRLGARRVAYRLSDVEAWAASRTFKSRAAEMAQQAA